MTRSSNHGEKPTYLVDTYQRNLYDIFQHALHFKKPGYLLLVDFSKAFDSISFDFILATLKQFGFKNKFIGWVKTLLENFSSQTVVNRHLSLRILLERGCRQGDPIAGYLFILAIKVLLLRVFHESAIQGQQNLPTGVHP